MSTIAIVGAGYVGVPLAHVFAGAGHTVLLVDVQADRVEQLNRGESYIEDVPSEELKKHIDAGLLTATTDYDELKGADAILVALPDAALGPARARPDDPARRDERDRAAPAAGPAGRARVDDLPGHDARADRAAARGERPQGGRELPPRLLARARRPGPRGLDDEDDPEGRRRPHRGVHAPRGRAVRERRRRGRRGLLARGRRADEAAREHLPLGQHRARQRARAALRTDGARHLGDRRRGGDEALRVHALRARARARRPLPARRPVLPLVEGAPVRLLHRVHRAGGQGQPEHAVLLPLADLAGA